MSLLLELNGLFPSLYLTVFTQGTLHVSGAGAPVITGEQHLCPEDTTQMVK